MYPQALPTSGLAIASLVCGIASFFCLCIGLPLGVAALITGFIGRSRIQASRGYVQGNGLALAGIITGSIGLVLNLIWLAIWGFALIATAVGAAGSPSGR